MVRLDTLKRTQDKVNKPWKSLHNLYIGWILYVSDDLKLKKRLTNCSLEFHIYLSGQGEWGDQPSGPHLLPLLYKGLCFSGLPWWLIGKESPCQCRRYRKHGLDPWVGKIPGAGNGNPLQYSCLGNPTDRGALWAIVHGVPRVRPRLSN